MELDLGGISKLWPEVEISIPSKHLSVKDAENPNNELTSSLRWLFF